MSTSTSNLKPKISNKKNTKNESDNKRKKKGQKK